MPANLANRAAVVLLGLAVLCTACTPTGPSPVPLTSLGPLQPPLGPPASEAEKVKGFYGAVAADEPYAAIIARNVLTEGGNAADAAVAAALLMSVSLPSRAGLGGGGACLAFVPKRPAGPGPDAILFEPPAASPAAGLRADRPAAVPMMARGLFLLAARYGTIPFERLIGPAEQAARGGITASRALVQDLRVVAGPLAGDPVAASIFLPGGAAPREGQSLFQPELAATLAQIRVAGVGDLHTGTLARQFAAAAQEAGGGIVAEDLRSALPRVATPLRWPGKGGDIAYFPPTDGGLATAVSFRMLFADPTAALPARDAGLAAASLLRSQGGDPAALLTAANLSAPALPQLPASAGLAVIDKDGGAVTCAFTMNNLFGTGRIAGHTGVLLAASPRALAPPLLAAGLIVNPNLKAFRAAAAGTGQNGAPMAAAVGLSNALQSGRAMAVAVPDPGRADVITCPRYLPDSEGSCNWATDPRGAGFATGGQ